MPAPSETSSRTVGRYVLHGELAAGGMATVHLGRLSGPEGFSRTVAIKRLHPEFAKDQKFVTMFRDEARLVGRIRHPNVVPTLDVVTTEGEIFIVMEYVAGEAFSKLLSGANAKGQFPPLKVVATIIASVLHGLHAAHQTRDENGVELGIVHRDVSPQNILVGIDGAARLLDFGVAKAAGRLQTTREGELKGKVAYMSPEQLSGATATLQADVYAAAVVMWEALAQRRLFEGDSEAAVFVRALQGRIEPPSKYNPHVDASVDALVLRGLARDPAKRFATAREMALAIERTIGVASSTEVGEWVELLARDALHRRAQKVSAVENSRPGDTSSTQMAAVLSGSDIHGDLSSITVSSQASSVPSAKRSGRRKVMTAAFTLLAVVGVVAFGIMAKPESGARPRFAANRYESGPLRELDRIGPVAVYEKAAPTPETSAVAPPSVRPQPPVVRVEAKAESGDPPYIIDSATGRRTYKRQCI